MKGKQPSQKRFRWWPSAAETSLRTARRRVAASCCTGVFRRSLIAANPGGNPRSSSLQVCSAWGWVQQNGLPGNGVCRGLLLALARAGHIELPPPQSKCVRPWMRRTPALPTDVDQRPIVTSLADLGPVEICQVPRTPAEALFGGLIQAYHYRCYVQPVGEHPKFIAYAAGRPVACLAWSSVQRHLGPRHRSIGWSPQAHRANIRYVAYNSRIPDLAGGAVPHLASHILGRITRMLASEWERIYGHPVHLAETFVDRERHRGSCHRAANWMLVGQTTGRGTDDRLHRRANRPVENVLCRPLVGDFRERLRRVAEEPRLLALTLL